MKIVFPAACNIHLVCKDAISQYSTTYIYLNSPKRRLEATDGRTAVIVPLDESSDLGNSPCMFIDPRTVEAAINHHRRGLATIEILDNNRLEVPAALHSAPIQTDEKWPDLDAVFKIAGTPHRFGVDTLRCYEAARAIGSWENKPVIEIVVEPNGEVFRALTLRSAYGTAVVMPCNLDVEKRT